MKKTIVKKDDDGFKFFTGSVFSPATVLHGMDDMQGKEAHEILNIHLCALGTHPSAEPGVSNNTNHSSTCFGIFTTTILSTVITQQAS